MNSLLFSIATPHPPLLAAFTQHKKLQLDTTNLHPHQHLQFVALNSTSEKSSTPHKLCIKSIRMKLMSKCTEKHAGTLHKFLECKVLLLTVHQVNPHASQIKSKRVRYSTYSLIGIYPCVQYITLITNPTTNLTNLPSKFFPELAIAPTKGGEYKHL